MIPLLLTFSILLSFESNALETPDLDPLHPNIVKTEKSKWFVYVPVEKVKAKVLVLHGLNTKPSSMDFICEFLAENGFLVLRMALQGHREHYLEFYKVNRKVWLDQLNQHYKLINGVSDKLPMYGLGFSIGGLYLLDSMSDPKYALEFDRLVLFAPAIELPWYAHFSKIFQGLGDFSLISLNHVDYRANDKTPVAAYKALHDSREATLARDLSITNVPSLVVIDPKDELVSYPKLKKLKENRKLTQWQFLEVNKSPKPEEKFMKHLIIDERTLGGETWKKVKAAVLDHLN